MLMYKNENFDNILKSSLTQRSNNLFVNNKMFDKIINGVETKQSKRKGVSFLTKKFVPIAISFSLCVCLFLVFSPQARVWAAEGVSKIYLIISGENGYKVEEKDVLRITNSGLYVIKEDIKGDVVDTYVVGYDKLYKKPVFEKTGLSGEKLNHYLGYEVKLPLLLPEEFKLLNKSIVKSKNSSLLLAVYENTYKINLIAYNKPLTSGSENTSIKVGDKDGAWYQSPLPLDKDGEVVYNLAQKPEIVKTNHILSWEDSGVYYSLMDLGNDMTKEMAVELANSILASN